MSTNFSTIQLLENLRKGIKTLLSSGRDELQIFDLCSNAMPLRQNPDNIEVFFGKLIVLWKEIDRRMPNLMTLCSRYHYIYHIYPMKNASTNFLQVLTTPLIRNVTMFSTKSHFPTLDVVYATIRREIVREGIMTPTHHREWIP